MAKRTVCLCGGKYIGIETIFTVINGQQINIPEKLKELRVKSQNNELFCPCGCGANLILVAGDRNLREQHFRLKEGFRENECHVVSEGKPSIDSKIVLKCWLDEKLKTDDVKTRVPINFIGDTDRKYEFSFLSRNRNIAISYCYERANLSDDKFDVLKVNSNAIKLMYIVDIMNSNSNGQYPERLMKIQDRQGYCLLLEVDGVLYRNAKMYAVFYSKNNDGLWREIKVAEGYLRDYTISKNGQLLYKSELVSGLSDKSKIAFEKAILVEKKQREEDKKHHNEKQKLLQEETIYKRLELEKKQENTKKEIEQRQEKMRLQREKDEAEYQAKKKQREEDFKKNMKENFSQQKTPVRDAEGNRWIKCEYCGLIAKDSEFSSYGGVNHVNLGVCQDCSAIGLFGKNIVVQKSREESKLNPIRYDDSICPECGGKLQKKSGRYGKFIGCSNYPNCTYTMTIKK